MTTELTREDIERVVGAMQDWQWVCIEQVRAGRTPALPTSRYIGKDFALNQLRGACEQLGYRFEEVQGGWIIHEPEGQS